ncbi:hypothetical protein [Curtobacterium flaccumfaciens]|uniref:hypothetical protein n=1 Tax=Curtobacterium flaccumfaciens TaxID=2035 RepID=UPI0013678E91|nr:hypothetical protein [Curtobacterium flaccumfaciens]MBT1666645.1 hypothetical protein [Curtobacterium flaccumfaciens pv. flaccumfaciens]QHN62450.1 hypothetical protein GBG65_19370 [Curtobacterium flaccumfaciens pv. flaccumfaciens]
MPSKTRRGIVGTLTDFPTIVTGLIVIFVAVQLLASLRWPELNVAHALATSDVADVRSALSSLALGVAGVSALVGGFAGVVVVFGLGTENDRFRLLRAKGGRRLRASWISVVLSSFASAFGAVIAAVTVVAFDPEVAMWILELCVIIAAHGAIRLTLLLAGLAKIVDSNDDATVTQERLDALGPLVPDKDTLPPSAERGNIGPGA